MSMFDEYTSVSCSLDMKRIRRVPQRLALQGASVFVVLLLHLALYWLAYGARRDPVFNLPQEGGPPTMTVALMGRPGNQREGATADSPVRSPLEAMRERLTAAGGSIPLSEPPSLTGDLDSLFGPRQTEGGAARAAAGSGAGEGTGRAGDPRDQVSLAPGQFGSSSSGQAAPCWRKPAAPTLVRMVVMVDDRGAVVGTPRLTRRGGAIAEAQAWRAMAGCAPYAAARAGRYRAIELDFAGGADWVRPAGFVEIR